MGLDSYMFTADVEKENSIIVVKEEKAEIAYWRKCWFLHQYLANIYLETIDNTDTEFNCTVMKVDLDILKDLHQAMSKEAYQQHLSLDEPHYSDIVDTNDINELKTAIKYLQNNPTETLYYTGWY